MKIPFSIGFSTFDISDEQAIELIALARSLRTSSRTTALDIIAFRLCTLLGQTY